MIRFSRSLFFLFSTLIVFNAGAVTAEDSTFAIIAADVPLHGGWYCSCTCTTDGRETGYPIKREILPDPTDPEKEYFTCDSYNDGKHRCGNDTGTVSDCKAVRVPDKIKSAIIRSLESAQ
ncbi:MAG: hypothetical protein AB7P04_03160 [Bacteriovoracia bacterium]